ncbi:MAG: hypothetical protein KKE51_11770 [Gammaproteobacteria bacterium]|nr:hypothetical protein [Gammaproteobacteria bacterium]MBU2447776.1 hypothetical protein [Gammaproteobacteria bacterium]
MTLAKQNARVDQFLSDIPWGGAVAITRSRSSFPALKAGTYFASAVTG